MSAPIWTDERAKQFEMLEKMLLEIKGINHGSGCLGRITKCIEMAEALTKWGFGDAPSFINFLRDQVIADRIKHKATGVQA